MIEIEIQETGDSAEAETPEAALVAARTLGSEARVGKPWGFDPTIIFRVDGVICRATTLRTLNREVPSALS